MRRFVVSVDGSEVCVVDFDFPQVAVKSRGRWSSHLGESVSVECGHEPIPEGEWAQGQLVERENPLRTRVYTHNQDGLCRVYLDGEDVSDYCYAADEELGVVCLFGTEPGKPKSRVTAWEKAELKRYARVGDVRIVDLVEVSE